MKKRLVSILLTLCLLLSVIPLTSIISSATTIDRSTWTVITGSTTISESGDYYLNENVVGNIVVNADVTATIDLNGYVLCGDATNSVIINNGVLTITDNNPTSVHHFSDSTVVDGLWVWDNSELSTEHTLSGGCITGGHQSSVDYGGGITNLASLTLDSGLICGNRSHDGGGVFNDENADFTMTGGAIIGNVAVEAEYSIGGGVCNKGTFTLKAGVISYNKSRGSGGGILNQSIFNMTGGEISYNCSRATGGGALNYETLSMTGGSIIHNSSQDAGGGLYINTSSNVTLGGNAVIKNNEGVISDLPANIEATESNVTFDPSSQYKGFISIATGDDTPKNMEIGINSGMTLYPVPVTTASDQDYSKYFFSDTPGEIIYNIGEGNNQQLYFCNCINVDTNKPYAMVSNAFGLENENQTIKLLCDTFGYLKCEGTYTFDLNGYMYCNHII